MRAGSFQNCTTEHEAGISWQRRVLHGVVRYVVKIRTQGNVVASARSQMLATIAKVFRITEAEIGVGVDTLSFSVAESPAPKTQAIVPD